MIYPILTPVPAHYRRVMIFDVETTGLTPRNLNVHKLTPEQLKELPHIIQISWLIYNVVSNRIESTFNAYIRIAEEVPLIDRITEITGITRDMLREKGQPIVPVLESFYTTYLKCDMVVAHNIDFDQTLIGIEIARNLESLAASPTAVCPMYSMKALFTPEFNALHCVDLYCTMMATIDMCGLPHAEPVPVLPPPPSMTNVFVRTPEQGGTTCIGGRGLSVDGLPSKDNENPTTTVPPIKAKQWPNRRPKFPRLSELHQVLFGNIPENLHNSLIDVLVCLRCFLKIRCCVDVPEKSFERMIRKATTC
jgi:DNA polymerase III epsilon subunit-like protein